MPRPVFRPPAARRSVVLVLAAVGALVLAGCTPPGGSSTPSEPPATTTAVDGGPKPSCGTSPITMKGYFETGFPLPKALTDEFTRQFPTVTWKIREDKFAVITQNAARVLSDNPPDLMRLPQLTPIARKGLLRNLDWSADAFGWDKWPASQLDQLRVRPDAMTRGAGPLFAGSFNFSMTGVFYNKELAAKIGMTTPPATLNELDALLAKAKEAGITPIAQFNGGETGGLVFPLQNLMATYGEAGPINDWIFNKPGATINTPNNLKAVEHLQRWAKAGYFAPDINSMDYTTMMGRFTDGKSLFIFNGDWESGNLDKKMPGKAGFFLVPPIEAGGKQAAMSAPDTYVVAAKASYPDCAAFFLNWVATNEKAREISVQVSGSRPMGPADAPIPPVTEGTVTAATLAAGAKISQDNGSMDFIANATGAIYAKSWTPQLQKLATGAQQPAALLQTIQRDYENQITG